MLTSLVDLRTGDVVDQEPLNGALGSLDTGLFHSQSGRPKYYYASDSVQSEQYRGTGPADLVDIAMMHDLHYHVVTERGVVFHLIGALSEFGKLGMVCIGDNQQQAEFLYRKTRTVLDLVTRKG